MVGTLFRPLYLKALGETLADQRIDGGFDEGGGDPFPLAPALSIVQDRALVVGDVAIKLARLPNEALHAGIGGFDLGEIVGQVRLQSELRPCSDDGALSRHLPCRSGACPSKDPPSCQKASRTPICSRDKEAPAMCAL